MSWIKEKTENYVERIEKYEHIVTTATKGNNLTVVFFGDTKNYDREWRIYKAVGRKFNRTEVKFYVCERCKEFNIFDLVVYNGYDRVKTSFKSGIFQKRINYDGFFRFIDANIKPLVRNVTYELTDDLFKSKIPGLIVYYDSDAVSIVNGTELFRTLRKFAYVNKVRYR
jgi:hypothetical protein